MIDVNPALDVARPKDDLEEDPRSRALTAAEVEVVLSLMPAGHYRRFAAGLALTGMRAGELTAVRVLDVAADFSSIAVARSYSPGRSGELVLKVTKGRNARHVPVVNELRRYVTEAVKGKRPEALLFDGVRGGRLRVGTFRRAVNWSELRAVLGRPNFMVKDLRHTFATLLFDGGASANDVKDVMGHSSLQVTEIYTPARSDAARRVGRSLDLALNGTKMAQPDTQEEGNVPQ